MDKHSSALIHGTDKSYKHLALGFLLIIFLTFLAYHPALKGGFIWDDDQYVEENQNLRNFNGLKNIWTKPLSIPQWYPLTHTTFWMEYQLWELKPFGYHFNNILLHALNACLLWIILLRLKLPGAILAAAIFAIHPVYVESVAWITERKNVLSCFFCLLSLFTYLRYAKIFPESLNRDNRAEDDGFSVSNMRYYVFSMVFFVLALLSKTIVATLPAVILVLCWWRYGSVQKRHVLPLVPFFILGIGFGLLTAWLETHHVGAQGDEFDFNFIERCLIAGRALWFYLYKLIWPSDIMFIYPRWNIDAGQWWQYLYTLSYLIFLACLFFLRNRIGRGPLAAVLIFSGTLFPALGFLNVYPHRFSFVADHFQYLASIAIIVVICAAVSVFSAKVFTSPSKRRVLGVIAGLLFLNLGLKTAFLNFSYADVVTLWEDTIARNDKCWLAYNNLANAYLKKENFEKTISLAKRAIELKPDYDLAYVNLAVSYYYTRQYDSALSSYLKAIDLLEQSIDARDTYYFVTAPHCYEYVGMLYKQRGEWEASKRYLEKSIALRPDFWLSHKTLGEVYAHEGKMTDAIASLNKAVALHPDDAHTHYALGKVLSKTGDYVQAINQYERAMELRPDLSHSILKLIEKLKKLNGMPKGGA